MKKQLSPKSPKTTFFQHVKREVEVCFESNQSTVLVLHADAKLITVAIVLLDVYG